MALLTTGGRQYTAIDNLEAGDDDCHGDNDAGESERTMVKPIAKYQRCSDDYNIYDNVQNDEQAYGLSIEATLTTMTTTTTISI